MKKLLIILITLLISGCAALSPPPPAPKSALAKGSKVGILVSSDSEFEHLHVGTTIFNNFSHSVTTPWNMQPRTQEYFSKALSDVGFNVLDLKAAGFNEKLSDALVIEKDKEWNFNPENQHLITRLRKEFGLDAIVKVSPVITRVRNECSSYGCAETYMNKSGLFTRGMFLSTRYFAVTAVHVSVYRLNEPSNLSVYDPLRTVLESRVTMLRDFSDPIDLRHMTDAEFNPITESIAKKINELSAATASVLANAATIP
jgi:hypothetical protein